MLFFSSVVRAVVPLGLLLPVLVSCSRQDPAPAETMVITWTIDGQTMTTMSARQTAIQTSDGLALEITGSVSAAQGGAGMIIVVPKRLGTYPLAPNNWEVYAAYSGGGLFRSTSGSIIVTSLTPTSLKGTFNFTGHNDFVSPAATKSITNGTFHVAL